MGKTQRAGGLYYINGKAVDAHGKEIEGAPERPANTDPSKQPGAIGASTPEERMGKAIAEAINAGTVKVGTVTPPTAAKTVKKAE